ncbi:MULTISPECIES: iron ABC transporter permease [unclassified Nodularia (in: cyanobacteria)]|uniref:ABC transporter permease n=1 Tax=unclassified Nodularia (in: cyanobacteria) TaxID=2656917 RepID=UPI00187EB97D|nr:MULTISPECIES: iron ABC transporter permease [unclassified Nodularia (in: cyanobacteria)]MBE9198936.1 iron ABC transporter permease [Nodularia sp. LEGE 06071]MCC2692714.1 iron ABC transporter permease [Nodularia sp. LEGE 04288]
MKSSVRPPLFLILAAAVVAVAITLPLVYLVIRAVGIGGDEFWALISRPRNITVFFNSAAMAATVTLFSTLIAIPLAFLTVRTDLPARKFWLVATTLPLAVPSYVGSFALIATLAPRGSFLQLLLQPLGVEELPSIYGFPGAVLAITLFTYPYLLLSVRSGLQGIDPSIEEAGRSLGYSSKETFFKVVLPQLKPSMIAGGLLVALYSLRDFGTPSLMRFDAFTRVIFIQYKASFNRNTAAVLSLMLVTLVLLILWLEYRVRSRAAYYSRGSASLRPPKIVKLGIWKWPALCFCFLITSFGVVLPVGITLFWLIRGLNTGYSFPNLLPSILNSVSAAGLAAIAATIFALPVAILSVRFPTKITAIIERCSYIGFGVPGIVVALSLVFFGANYLPFLYQTLPMLIFAYLVLFLPQSVGAIRTSLLQVNPQLEESARSLGRNPWQALREVTLPLVRPGVLSGAVLVFLTAIKELPATMLLAPIGFNTLATQIWQATENVDFADAAASSLAMLLVSMGSTLLVLSQENVKKEKVTPNAETQPKF